MCDAQIKMFLCYFVWCVNSISVSANMVVHDTYDWLFLMKVIIPINTAHNLGFYFTCKAFEAMVFEEHFKSMNILPRKKEKFYTYLLRVRRILHKEVGGRTNVGQV